MDDKLIERINELSKKSKCMELTQCEKEEQATLRRQYIDALKGSLECNLNNIILVDKDGNKQKLQKK